jgi:hypothetical protein
VVAIGAAACGGSPSSAATPTSTDEIPDETAGPFPGDGSNGPDVLGESGIVRDDIRSSFGPASGRGDGRRPGWTPAPEIRLTSGAAGLRASLSCGYGRYA